MHQKTDWIELNRQPVFTVGVVADTHIPDRVNQLHPQLVPILNSLNVDAVFHAGDISSRAVLETLNEIAPIYAVTGNRDFLLLNQLPSVRFFLINGIKVGMMHGHGGLLNYIKDKWYYLRVGYCLERYVPILFETLKEAEVIIFGHTHRPVNFWRNGRLLFNPGASSQPTCKELEPSIGVLRFCQDGRVEGEVVELDGAYLEHRHWKIAEENKKIK